MNGRNSKDEPIIMYKPDYDDYGKLKIMLGHSCDEWLVGDVEEARAFHAQLGTAIAHAENFPDQEFSNDD